MSALPEGDGETLCPETLEAVAGPSEALLGSEFVAVVGGRREGEQVLQPFSKSARRLHDGRKQLALLCVGKGAVLGQLFSFADGGGVEGALAG